MGRGPAAHHRSVSPARADGRGPGGSGVRPAGALRGHGTARRQLCYPPPGQRRLGAAQRESAPSVPRPTKPRSAGPLSELRVPGGLVGPTSTGHRQDRTSPRGTVSPGGLHRHDARGDQPGRRPLLQSARDGRAVDQRGQDRHALDSPLLSSLPGQRGAPPAWRHRLQPRQSPTAAGSARRHPELVPHESPAAAVQDRRGARPPPPLLPPPPPPPRPPPTPPPPPPPPANTPTAPSGR